MRIIPIDIPAVKVYRRSPLVRRTLALLFEAGIITNDGMFRLEVLCALQDLHDREPWHTHRWYFEELEFRNPHWHLQSGTIEKMYLRAKR